MAASKLRHAAIGIARINFDDGPFLHRATRWQPPSAMRASFRTVLVRMSPRMALGMREGWCLFLEHSCAQVDAFAAGARCSIMRICATSGPGSFLFLLGRVGGVVLRYVLTLHLVTDN